LPTVTKYVGVVGMPRRLRLQYSGAIYHLMARGNGRQDIVRDDVDREWLQEQLGKAAIRCSWRVYAFAIMSNHRVNPGAGSPRVIAHPGLPQIQTCGSPASGSSFHDFAALPSRL
jgi:hypothetical protein